MRQISRRLDLRRPVHVSDYLDNWEALQRRLALKRRLNVLAPKPIMLHIPPQTEMSVPTGGPKLDLWIRQNGRCQYCCGSLLPRYHVDHIHPKSKGGTNTLENYCLACQPCNHSKHNKSVMDFVLYLLTR